MKNGSILDERRRAQRVTVPMEVAYVTAGGKRVSSGKAKCVDVGGLGFGLTLRRAVKPKQDIRLKLKTPSSKKTTEITCRVIWCEDASASGYRVGLAIKKVSDPAAFIDYMCNHMITDSQTKSHKT